MSWKILQFDDDELMAQMYKVKFEQLGFEHIWAEHPPTKNPEDLINYVLGVKPDFIVMDIIMPVMDGFKATEILKNNTQTKKIPLFFLSNIGQKEDIKRGIGLGAEDYFVAANHTPTEVTQRIQDYLNKPEKYRPTFIDQLYKLPLFFKFEGQIFKAEETKDGDVASFIFDDSFNEWQSISFGNFIEASNWGQEIDSPQDSQKDYPERFKAMSDEQLIEAFNSETNKSGWTSTRASYLAAIQKEFERRNYDYSAIGNKRGLTLQRVKIIGKKLLPDNEHPAKVIEYSNYSENMAIQCPVCNWKGTPKKGGLIEHHDELLDVSCPNCDKMLLVVNYPRAEK